MKPPCSADVFDDVANGLFNLKFKSFHSLLALAIIAIDFHRNCLTSIVEGSVQRHSGLTRRLPDYEPTNT